MRSPGWSLAEIAHSVLLLLSIPSKAGTRKQATRAASALEGDTCAGSAVSYVSSLRFRTDAAFVRSPRPAGGSIELELKLSLRRPGDLQQSLHCCAMLNGTRNSARDLARLLKPKSTRGGDYHDKLRIRHRVPDWAACQAAPASCVTPLRGFFNFSSA